VPVLQCELFSERLNHFLGGFRAGKILLTGNQVAVAHRETAPQPGLDVVRADLLHAVVDAPGRDMLVAAEVVHAPYGVVGELLLDVREAGDGFSFGEIFPIAEFREGKERVENRRFAANFPERRSVLPQPCVAAGRTSIDEL